MMAKKLSLAEALKAMDEGKKVRNVGLLDRYYYKKDGLYYVHHIDDGDLVEGCLNPNGKYVLFSEEQEKPKGKKLVIDNDRYRLAFDDFRWYTIKDFFKTICKYRSDLLLPGSKVLFSGGSFKAKQLFFDSYMEDAIDKVFAALKKTCDEERK